MNNIYDALKEIFQNFRWIDDIPGNQAMRDEICLQGKVDLLLEANINSEVFPAFIRLGERRSETGKRYKLPDPAVYVYNTRDNDNNDFSLSVFGEDVEFGELNQFGKYWGLPIIKKDYSHEYYEGRVAPQDGGWINSDAASRILYSCSKEMHAAFYKKYPTLYSICQGLTPYQKLPQICRFWKNSSDTFGKITVRNMRPDYIWSTATLRRNSEMENWTDARVEQYAFRYLIPCQSPLQGAFALRNRYFDNWYCHVFPFRNQYGETIMNLLKIYDPETQYKYFVPVTTWIRNNSSQTQIFCVPYPDEKTPLYNLDLLLRPECQTVILCDSVELADANQHALDDTEGIVFTSFLCSPGRCEQVDWTPLQDKNVCILVSNHSGMMLDTAALKAKELRDYLCEEQEISSTLAVVPVEYGKQRHRDFQSVDDILKRFADNQPKITPYDVRIIELERDIETFFQNAERKLNELPDKWWKDDDVPPEEKRVVEEQKSKPKPIDFILHPLLVRGEATMLYAQKGVGKSAIAYSIAARVVATGFSAKPVPLLKEKWWTTPKGQYKVLYLDFENMGEMEKKKRAFQDGYFPVNKEKECRDNLIMMDLSQAGIDFSAPENQQKLLDMLEDARKNKGIPNKQVDLLVIDTYTAFVRAETPATPANFKDLINKIRNMGIAVLVTHHANSENEARGLASKMDALFLTVNMSCDPEAPEGDLDEQPRIITYQNPRGPMNSKIRVPFKIRFVREKKHWKCDDSLLDENAELALFVDMYKKEEYDRDTICRMLGLEKSALSDRLKQARK